jgi:hypothetical protein
LLLFQAAAKRFSSTAEVSGGAAFLRRPLH